MGAVILLWRKPAMKVMVSHSPCGTGRTSRSPRGQRPRTRTIFVVIAVSSINTSRVVSRNPCCRIQSRRARATSFRCRSAAQRLFFIGEVMTLEKSPERGSAARNPLLVHRRDYFVQGPILLLGHQSKDPIRVLLQDRTAAPARFRFTRSLFTPSLDPSDGRTDTDLEQLGRLASRRPRLYCSDYSLTQVTRVRLWHRWPPHRRINADRLAHLNGVGKPSLFPLDSDSAENAVSRSTYRAMLLRSCCFPASKDTIVSKS